MISLREWGLTRINYKTAIKMKPRQQALTSYSFHKGYCPIVIGNNLIIDFDKVFIALNFKNSKDLAEWRMFEAGLDEVTYQAGILKLNDISSPLVRVREIEKLKTSFLKASEGIHTLIDASTGSIYRKASSINTSGTEI